MFDVFNHGAFTLYQHFLNCFFTARYIKHLIHTHTQSHLIAVIRICIKLKFTKRRKKNHHKEIIKYYSYLDKQVWLSGFFFALFVTKIKMILGEWILFDPIKSGPLVDFQKYLWCVSFSKIKSPIPLFATTLRCIKFITNIKSHQRDYRTELSLA